jgi:hypothetical protein
MQHYKKKNRIKHYSNPHLILSNPKLRRHYCILMDIQFKQHYTLNIWPWKQDPQINTRALHHGRVTIFLAWRIPFLLGYLFIDPTEQKKYSSSGYEE